jgi:hypothetical protein
MVYQVDDSVYTGTQPFYRIILTEANRLELQNINRQSDAEVHCTFVTVDGVETQVRHNCGVRTRGAGSRGANPSNYRLNIPNDNPWKGLDAINLNTQFTHAQAVGSVVAQRSGMTAADARLVQVRVNGVNLANAGSPQFGSYVPSTHQSRVRRKPLSKRSRWQRLSRVQRFASGRPVVSI